MMVCNGSGIKDAFSHLAMFPVIHTQRYTVALIVTKACLFTSLNADAFHNSFAAFFFHSPLPDCRRARCVCPASQSTHYIRTFNIISFIHFYAFIAFSLAQVSFAPCSFIRYYVYFMIVYVRSTHTRRFICPGLFFPSSCFHLRLGSPVRHSTTTISNFTVKCSQNV